MTLQWSTACPDWEQRIVERASLIPLEPLFPEEAEAALAVFKSLRIVDLAGQPTFGEVAEDWVFDFVRAIFGAYNVEEARRYISEFFLLISKKNGKSTIAAGIMITALIRNWRHSAELLILAPTIEVAKNSFEPARDMVLADPELDKLLHVQENFRQITHRITKAVLKVIAADSDTVGGKKAAFVLVDELWIFGKRAGADAMLREATGGLVSRPEGFVIYLSTQSDAQPAGVFKEKLRYFRNVRDGVIKDPKKLAVLYEFPEPMIKDGSYLNPANWYITNPNLEVSVSREWLEDKTREAQGGAPDALAVHLAKHLNVEIGQLVRVDGWAGALFWAKGADKTLTLAELKRRSEVVVVGIDGGGLDDLLGLVVLGREKGSRKWLLWARAWGNDIVKERRKDIVSRLNDFVLEGTLKFVRDGSGDDVTEVVDIIMDLDEAGLLPEEGAVCVDRIGIVEIVNELARREFDTSEEAGRIHGVNQGYALQNTIKSTERKVAAGNLIHEGSDLMNWTVGNAKIELKGNALVVQKQIVGYAKIDALIALFNAATSMGQNPEPARSVYEEEDYLV